MTAMPGMSSTLHPELGALESATVRHPDFFIVGAAKAGTTSLFKYLIQHSSIFIPPLKEYHFFADYPPPSSRRVATLRDYLGLFAGQPPEVAAGEASTSYLPSVFAAPRIAHLFPEARILAILRDPVERAYSNYWHNRKHARETLSFEQALEAEDRRIAEGWPFDFHYVRTGMYHEQVARFLDAFGAEKVRILLLEDFRSGRRALLRDLFSFLEVDPEVEVDADRVHNRSGPPRNEVLGRVLNYRFPGRSELATLLPPARKLKNRILQRNILPQPRMSDDTRRRLVARFSEDIRRLEQLLDRDLGQWRAVDRRVRSPTSSSEPS